LLPKIGLAFLGANTSIFLIDWIISLCQTLVNAVLHATGGIGQAWILNAFDPATLLSGQTAMVTLIFVIIFILLAAVLLLFYISRLMVLAFGAVISPIVCLLWLLPGTTELASNLSKTYMVTIFTVFVHVVIIQLASAFLTIPGQFGTNPVISILIGIALFSLLLKSTATAMQMALAGGTSGAIKKLGSQLFNVMSANATKAATSSVNPVRHK
jgi:Co/Zn/Cd efflux system component